MKATRSLIFFAISVFACAPSERAVNDFEAFYSQLPVFEVPIRASCGGIFPAKVYGNYLEPTGFKEPPKGMDSSLFHRFLPRGMDQVQGRVFENDSTVSILYRATGDIVYGFLYTYDRAGGVIDSIALNGPCSEDEFLEVSSFAIVDDRWVIVNSDTAKSFVEGNVAEGRKADGVRVTVATFKIGSSGRITKVSSESREL